MYRTVLGNKSFVFFFLGGSISRLGDVLTGLAFLFLAHDMTGSAWHTTGVVIAETAPYLLFGLVGGVVADWLPRQKLLMIIDLVRAPLVLSVFLLHEAGQLSYVYLLIIGFLIQSLGCFFNPAHRAVLPLITTSDERPAANSLMDSASRGVQVLSPMLTVTLLGTAGVAAFFAFDAITYLMSAACLALLRVNEKAAASAQPRRLGDIYSSIREFVNWTKGEATLRKLFLVSFFTVFFNTWVWEVGLLLTVKQLTVNGEEWYSTLQGAFGGIVILTNLAIPLVWKQLSLRTYLLGAFIWGLGVLSLGGASHLAFPFLSIAIAGIGMPLAGLSRVYLLQQLVPGEKMGRGFSFNAMLLYLSNVLSLGVFGLISAYLPLNALFLLCGGMMAATACYSLYRLRKAPGETPYTRLNS
ncbi:MFS transporter [Brevibacillus sp. H7]|uniref:MFS transporter n=1 Tax=Brevibacillus sp. H7 TaxID=3349138 RepID=UPI00380F2671